jgi:hypothetical protein
MNKKILLLSSIIMMAFPSFSQFILMKDSKEMAIHIGSGNYFYHVDEEQDVKEVISEIYKLNRFTGDKPIINKKKNLVYSAYMVNPVNDEFVYFMYAIRTREGIDIYCLYCSNRYLHFFDYKEGTSHLSLIYDPSVNKNTSITNLSGIPQQ